MMKEQIIETILGLVVAGLIAGTMVYVIPFMGDEPFYLCLAVFLAAFFGSIFAVSLWEEIQCWGRENESRWITIRWPDGRVTKP